jgi:hypothetical protein
MSDWENEHRQFINQSDGRDVSYEFLLRFVALFI